MPVPNNTFGQIWNRVLLFAPDLPPPMAQEFVKMTYRQVIGDHSWSDTRKDAEILLPDAYTTGTITVTHGSTSIVGAGVDFTNSSLYVGQQICVGNIAPFYTITAVTQSIPAGTYDTLTIDRAYENESDSALTYSIGQYYVEFPTDLYVLERIRDQANGWYLITQTYNQEYLDRVDVRRQSTGTPTLCVPAPPRTGSDGTVYPRYEFWPRVQAQRFYSYRYRYNPELTANTDRILSTISPEVLVYGALAHAAAWPGTRDKPNPFFSSEVHASYAKLYDNALQNSIQQDLERAQDMIQIADDPRRTFPFDAKYIQSHIW